MLNHHLEEKNIKCVNKINCIYVWGVYEMDFCLILKFESNIYCKIMIYVRGNS
jgi:hypothetical protein